MPTNVQIEPSWKELLIDEFKKPYFTTLVAFVKESYQRTTVYPAANHIFNAFNLCPLSEVRVVILGQDPYHGAGQAHGLSFSVPDGVRLPPSLLNIFKEINDDLGIPIPTSGNLTRWATQGVLLLNATLTVEARTPGSHQHKGWEQFTDRVIQTISESKRHIVFMLWGAYAGKKEGLIDPMHHLILTSPHPSPFSAHRGFLGNRHFSQANEYLRTQGKKEISW